MSITDISTANYPEQLEKKKTRLAELLAPFSSIPIDVYPSQPSHYRMRAEFRLWHEKDTVSYAMHNPAEPNKPLLIEQFPVANTHINQLMEKLIAVLNNEPLLRKRVFQVEFLTSTSNDAVITLVYHRKLDNLWQEKAQMAASLLDVSIIGRSRGQKIIVGQDFISESFIVGGKRYTQRQIESSFSQPNASVNQQMLNWAYECCDGLGGDLLELYCGNGNFTLPLSRQFNKVLATEVSKTSTAAALHNIQENNCDNIAMVRLSSEELTQALNHVRPFRRLAHIDLDSYSFSTVLVDPPRAGLDPATLALVAGFKNILYVSCNPDSLRDNLQALGKTHQIKKAAFFDQFPYTHHMECGVFLGKL